MKKILFTLAVFLCWLGANAPAAISVGPGGSGILTFDSTPTNTSWSTLTIAGAATNFTDVATFDAAVIANTVATSVTTTLGTSGTQPPSQQNIARHNTAGLYLQTRPTGNSYLVLMATLQNDSGGPLSVLRISYDFDQRNAIPVDEDIPGQRVFWSLTGAAGSWNLISDLSTFTTSSQAQSLTANVSLGTWPAGGTLYILWADDNGPGGTADPMEGGYIIDNVVFSTGMTGIAISSPTNSQRFAFGLDIPVSASAALPGNITSVEFFADGLSLGIDTTAPYSVVYSGATQGDHVLTATATDDQANSLTSVPVTISVVPNVAPSVTITNLPSGAVLVGTTVASTAVATDSDGTVVTNVDWYVNGVLRISDPSSPFTFQLGDPVAGTHNIQAVATDNLGASASSSISVTVTNPLGVALIVTNGAFWKYLDDGSDQGTAWTQPASLFDDSLWSVGQAELGYGDEDANRPETTIVQRVGTDGTTNETIYFRYHFNVTDPTVYGGLIVRLLRDDGAIVYINGTPVYRTGISNEFGATIPYNMYTPPAVGDDGNVYQVTNISSSVLVTGPNVIAVEVHQASQTSTDVSFDLMLWGQGPQLTITRVSATQVEITWPAPATGCELQSSTTVGPTASWSNVGGVTTSGGLRRVTLSNTTGNRFFRLRCP